MNYTKTFPKDIPFNYDSDYDGRLNDLFYDDLAFHNLLPFTYDSEFIPELAKRQDILAAYLHDISVGFTDYTIEANEGTPNDVPLAPTPSAAGDAFYFGCGTTYSGLGINLTTSGVSGQTAWEYWNGAMWSPLTFLWKNYGAAQNLALRSPVGWLKQDWNKPLDWGTLDVNGLTAYWVRARSTVPWFTAPLAGEVFIADFIPLAGVSPKYFPRPPVQPIKTFSPIFSPATYQHRAELPEIKRLSYDYKVYAGESGNNYSNWFTFPFESYFIHFQCDVDTVLQFVYRDGSVSDEIAGRYMYRTLNLSGFRIKNYFTGFNARYQLVAFR